MPKFRVWKYIVSSFGDTYKQCVKTNLTQSRAEALRDKLDNQNIKLTIQNGEIVSYLMEPV